jgi:hypothetical protein
VLVLEDSGITDLMNNVWFVEELVKLVLMELVAILVLFQILLEMSPIFVDVLMDIMMMEMINVLFVMLPVLPAETVLVAKLAEPQPLKEILITYVLVKLDFTMMVLMINVPPVYLYVELVVMEFLAILVLLQTPQEKDLFVLHLMDGLMMEQMTKLLDAPQDV